MKTVELQLTIESQLFRLIYQLPFLYKADSCQINLYFILEQ